MQPLAGAVHVRSMIDSHNDDGSGLGDPIDDPIRTSPRDAIPREFEAQWLADALRILKQRPGHEFDDGRGREFGKPS